jgi:exodeoxyribonuclease-3
MGKKKSLRIASWNVNGLRACARKGFAAWLESSGATIVALQEVRARPDQLSPEIREPAGWHAAWNPAERPGYSGVGLLARSRPGAVGTALGPAHFDREGRLQFARFGALTVVNGYFPNGNGKNRDLSRIPYKLDFYHTLFDHLEPARAAGERILVMGDFNTCHRDIDLARPRQNRETSGFRPEEREELDRWLTHGWTDTYRHLHPERVEYSWWSQRKGVREKNVGWRLDMVLASPGAMEYVRDAAIHTEVMGSDHCPVSVDVDPDIYGGSLNTRLLIT